MSTEWHNHHNCKQQHQKIVLYHANFFRVSYIAGMAEAFNKLIARTTTGIPTVSPSDFAPSAQMKVTNPEQD
jgi:hypothetical protein